MKLLLVKELALEKSANICLEVIFFPFLRFIIFNSVIGVEDVLKLIVGGEDVILHPMDSSLHIIQLLVVVNRPAYLGVFREEA
jgi:hypothetical protein